MIASLLSLLFPPRLGFIERGQELMSSLGYHGRMTWRHGDVNDHLGLTQSACGPTKVWAHGRWNRVLWIDRHHRYFNYVPA